MVKLLFSVYNITEAKQSNRQGGARAGARAVDAPWCSAATANVTRKKIKAFRRSSSLSPSTSEREKGRKTEMQQG